MNYQFWKKSKKDSSKVKKSVTREWFDAIIFAVVAATIIRGLFIEAFTIPTGSMEKSLLIGDFLFVSKVNYGARTPITPLSFPFAHHTMPIIGTKAYSEAIKLPYYRLPGLSKIKNNDVVVFNYPMEDFRPTDKKENYIKRCIGIGGDTLKIVNGLVSINGKVVNLPEFGQMTYLVKTDGSGFNPKVMNDLKIQGAKLNMEGDYMLNLTASNEEKIKKFANVKAIQPELNAPGSSGNEVYPFDAKLNWTRDNYGPILIPRKGETIQLNLSNIEIYKRPIEAYEGKNKVEIASGEILINGKRVESYTFRQDYFWMMGDNRHFSSDSRYWGFVPEDHIVGKALFVWMSWDTDGTFLSKVRWNRLLMGIR